MEHYTMNAEEMAHAKATGARFVRMTTETYTPRGGFSPEYVAMMNDTDTGGN